MPTKKEVFDVCYKLSIYALAVYGLCKLIGKLY